MQQFVVVCEAIEKVIFNMNNQEKLEQFVWKYRLQFIVATFALVLIAAALIGMK